MGASGEAQENERIPSSNTRVWSIANPNGAPGSEPCMNMNRRMVQIDGDSDKGECEVDQKKSGGPHHMNRLQKKFGNTNTKINTRQGKLERRSSGKEMENRKVDGETNGGNGGWGGVGGKGDESKYFHPVPKFRTAHWRNAIPNWNFRTPGR